MMNAKPPNTLSQTTQIYPDVHYFFTVKLAKSENLNFYNFWSLAPFYLLFFAKSHHTCWLYIFISFDQKVGGGGGRAAYTPTWGKILKNGYGKGNTSFYHIMTGNSSSIEIWCNERFVQDFHMFLMFSYHCGGSVRGKMGSNLVKISIFGTFCPKKTV